MGDREWRTVLPIGGGRFPLGWGSHAGVVQMDEIEEG